MHYNALLRNGSPVKKSMLGLFTIAKELQVPVKLIPQCRQYSSFHRLSRLRHSQIRAEKFKKLYNVALVRHASNESWQNEIPQGYIPDIPDVPSIVDVDRVPALTELNALGEPTLQCIGLGGYTPPGLVQQMLEAIHVGLDVPWWTALTLLVVGVRLCILPLTINARKMIIKMGNIQPQSERIQSEMMQAQATSDYMESQKAQDKLKALYKKEGVKPSSIFKPMLIQAPIFFSVFLGIRGMANYPVFSMESGGLLWFQDLTVADPTMLLPAISALCLYINLSIGAESMKMDQQQNGVQKFMLYVMPGMSFVAATQFPAALAFYWACTNAFVLGQAMILKIPVIKEALGMPDPIKLSDVPKPMQNKYQKKFFKRIKDTYKTTQKAAEHHQRQQAESAKFKDVSQDPALSWWKTKPTQSTEQKTNTTEQSTKEKVNEQRQKDTER